MTPREQALLALRDDVHVAAPGNARRWLDTFGKGPTPIGGAYTRSRIDVGDWRARDTGKPSTITGRPGPACYPYVIEEATLEVTDREHICPSCWLVVNPVTHLDCT